MRFEVGVATCPSLCTNIPNSYDADERSARESADAKQWSLNAVAAASIATLREVQQPSSVLHPALTCGR